MAPDAPPPSDADLVARIEALEERVRALEARRSTSPVRRAERVARRWPTVRVSEARSEDVLGKVGVALLLVGVLFLLKWTLDQGLLTAAVRVMGAGAVGGALLALGHRLRAARPVLGRLLTGGGLAALYGTLWTAAVLYPLLPPVVAFVGLALVAALGLALALKQSDGALAVVATAGGLLTPLLLYREPGGLVLLALYTVLVLAGGAAAWARRPWPALLAALALGGWAVVLVAWLVEVGDGVGPGATVAFSVVVGATWLAAGVLPLLRATPVVASSRGVSLTQPGVWAPVLSALLVVPSLGAAWDWPRGVAVVLAAGLALAYGAASRTEAGRAAVVPLVLSAAAVAVWAAGRAFGFAPPDARALAVGVAAGALVVTLARREGEGEMRTAGHVLALGMAVALGLALWAASGLPWETPPRPDAARLARLLGAAALGAGALASVGLRSARGALARIVYLTAGHLMVLAALRIALRPLADGAALTSGAWGLYGIALVVLGLRRRDALVRGLGLGTVVATAAKVLLVDLPDVPVLWRVVLFMGLGALLLGVSYAVPGLLRGAPDESSDA